MVQFTFESPAGKLFITANEAGLLSITWAKQAIPTCRNLSKQDKTHQHIIHSVEQLKQYFDGKRQGFDLPLVIKGTEFQKSVWNALREIPYAKTVSYKEIARRIKNPRAVRAVGAANGRNPFCILVPCHRVIAADGGIGGYAGGISAKSKLLELEQSVAL